MAGRSLARVVVFVTLAVASAWPGAAQAQVEESHIWTPDRPDAVAPIGVTGDRTYEKGEVSFSYRFTGVRWDGTRSGTTPISTDQVLQDFFVAPLEMKAALHLFGLAAAPTDWLTVEAFVPFLSYLQMESVSADGIQFETESGLFDDSDRFGFGDAQFLSHLEFVDHDGYRAHFTAGFSAPLGSDEQRDRTPLSNESVQLPYPMQIGGGTWDLLGGLTVTAQNELASTGAQIMGTVRTGNNQRNYRLGNRFEANIWGSYRATEWVSFSIRAHTQWWGDVSGADPELNPNLNPVENPELQGGTRVDLPFGFNVHFPVGPLQGHRLGLEFAFPIHQDLNGPQLENDWSLTLGWRWAGGSG